jgi:hypothetical protein
MRCILLLFLASLLSCRDKGLVGGIGLLTGEQQQLKTLPTDMLSFKIDGVPDKNIRFIALNKPQPVYNRIVVTLPESYANGEKITARVKLPEGYVIRDFFLREYDPGNLELEFSKLDDIWLFVYDKKNDRVTGDFYIYVDPPQPIVAPGRGEKYEATIGRDDAFIFVPLKNLGTASTIDTKDSLSTRVRAEIRNKKTGKIYIGSGAYFLNNPGNDLFIAIPPETEAGEYEITVRRKERHVILPDPLVLVYGEPGVDVWPALTITQNQDQNLSFTGFNLRPAYAYHLELSNDFGETQVLKPVPDGHLSLTCPLPETLSPGNYRADLYINKTKVTPRISSLETVVAVKSRTSQPAITLISDEQHAVVGEVTLYSHVSVLKKRQPVIADFRDGVREKAVLLFKNTATHTEYEVPVLDFTPALHSFPRFKIPADVPTGRYEVRSKHGTELSERYHKIIVLEE